MRSVLWLLWMACDGDGDGENERDTGDSGGGDGPFEIAEGLPDGDWGGEVTQTCGTASPQRLVYDVHIEDDVLLRDFSDGQFSGVSLDTFVFTATGEADWLGLDGLPIGACVAEGDTLTCETFADQAVQEQRTLTFLADILQWHAVVSLAGEVCTAEGALARAGAVSERGRR